MDEGHKEMAELKSLNFTYRDRRRAERSGLDHRARTTAMGKRGKKEIKGE